MITDYLPNRPDSDNSVTPKSTFYRSTMNTLYDPSPEEKRFRQQLRTAETPMLVIQALENLTAIWLALGPVCWMCQYNNSVRGLLLGWLSFQVSMAKEKFKQNGLALCPNFHDVVKEACKAVHPIHSCLHHIKDEKSNTRMLHLLRMLWHAVIIIDAKWVAWMHIILPVIRPIVNDRTLYDETPRLCSVTWDRRCARMFLRIITEMQDRPVDEG